MWKRASVVSDDPIIQRLLERLLLDDGWDVSVWASPHDLLAALPEERTDLIVADADLRGGEGALRACLALREALPSCPLLYVSGDGENIRRCREAGGCEILEKPFLPKEFLAALACFEDRRAGPT